MLPEGEQMSQNGVERCALTHFSPLLTFFSPHFMGKRFTFAARKTNVNNKSKQTKTAYETKVFPTDACDAVHSSGGRYASGW